MENRFLKQVCLIFGFLGLAYSGDVLFNKRVRIVQEYVDVDEEVIEYKKRIKKKKLSSRNPASMDSQWAEVNEKEDLPLLDKKLFKAHPAEQSVSGVNEGASSGYGPSTVSLPSRETQRRTQEIVSHSKKSTKNSGMNETSASSSGVRASPFIPANDSPSKNTATNSNPKTTSDSSPRALVSKIELKNGELIITGSNLSEIKTISINGHSLSASLIKISSSASRVVAMGLSGIQLGLGKIYNLVIAEAHGATTYPIEIAGANQIVQLDADGKLPAVDGSLLTGLPWENVTGGINYAGGNVGIQTSAPETTLDVSGEIKVGSTAVSCSSALAGSLRFDSDSKVHQVCDGAQWVGLGSYEPIPANSVFLSDVCPAGWTDIGGTAGGPQAVSCNSVSCRRCQSPATTSLVPPNTNFLMETCPSNWTSLGAIVGSPLAGGYQYYSFVTCQSPGTLKGAPLNSRFMMDSCQAPWIEVGQAAVGGSFAASCNGVPCKVCEVPGVARPSFITGSSGAVSNPGQSAMLKGGNGGSTLGAGGSAYVIGGNPVDGAGGSVTLRGSNAATTTASNFIGGSVNINGGDGVGTGAGGSITLSSGVSGDAIKAPIILQPNSGNVGIGTLTPQYLLDVNGDINILNTSALLFGGVSICTSAGCTAVSDKRLKKNINPLVDSLERILKLQGVEYDWKDKKQYGNEHQVGFLAQDLEKVYPEVVKTDKKTGLKSLAYGNLVAPIIEAIKELYQKVVTLFERTDKHARAIASIKEENEALKKENEEMKEVLCELKPKAKLCLKKK